MEGEQTVYRPPALCGRTSDAMDMTCGSIVARALQ